MQRLQQWAALAAALVLGGCAGGADMRYSPGATPRSWGDSAPCVAPPTDLRWGLSGGRLVPGQDYASDWTDLSASIVEHAQGAGLAPLEASGSAEQQAEGLLAEAKRRGAPLLVVGLNESTSTGSDPQVTYLWFVFGLGPGFVAMALPMHDEFAAAGYQACLIDPSSQELLGRFQVRGEARNRANAYSFNPAGLLPDAHRDAVDQLLGQVALAAEQGFPAREPLEDPLAFLAQQRSPGAGAPEAANAPVGPPAFLTRWEEFEERVTRVEQVLETLGKPAVDGPDEQGRRMLFWTYSDGEVSSSLAVFVVDGVVDEVRFTQTD